MGTHLRKASEKYANEKERIQPISEMDAELITVLIDTIEQRGWTDLSDILKDYKKIDDEMVLDRLAEYSISIDGEDEMDQPEQSYGKKPAPKEFVEIGGRIFRTFGLFTFRRLQTWDDEKGAQYCLVINEGPLPGSAQWYMDTLIPFDNKEDREKEWIELQNKMKKQNCKFL